jgi:hypothetical protein
MVVCTCNPSYFGGRGRKISSSRLAWTRWARPYFKNKIKTPAKLPGAPGGKKGRGVGGRVPLGPDRRETPPRKQISAPDSGRSGEPAGCPGLWPAWWGHEEDSQVTCWEWDLGSSGFQKELVSLQSLMGTVWGKLAILGFMTALKSASSENRRSKMMTRA